MSDSEFFRTRMGRYFFEKTMPDLVRELERLNNLLELIVRETRDRRQADRAQDAQGA